MKGNIRAVALLLSITGLIGSVATYKVATIIFSGMQYASISYHIDERISPNLQQQIIAYIENNRSISSQILINDIHSQFACVDSVQLQHSPHAVDLYVSACDILAVINNQFAVTASGIMLEKEQYNSSFFADFKHIKIPQMCELQLPTAIHSWIDQAPLEIFKVFDIAWFTENHIELQHKKDPQLVICCTNTQPINSLVIDACTDAKKALMGNNMRASHHEVIADVRFDRQIIVSKR